MKQPIIDVPAEVSVEERPVEIERASFLDIIDADPIGYLKVEAVSALLVAKERGLLGTNENWPYCVVCRKLVDHLHRRDIQGGVGNAYRYGDQVLFTAECHGRLQTSILNESDMLSADAASFGLAFLEEAACRAVTEGLGGTWDDSRKAGLPTPPLALPSGDGAEHEPPPAGPRHRAR